MKLHNILNIVFTLSLMLATASASAEVKNDFSSAQKAQIEQIVHSYLVANPQVLVEVSQKLREQQDAKMQQRAQKAIPENVKTLFFSPLSPAVGNPNGDISVVEFYDYQCGHCKEMAPVIANILKSDKHVRVIYKGLPVFGADSIFAAKAALAAQKEGKFTELHDALMKAQGPLTNESVLQIAKDTGLDTDKLKKLMADPALTQQLKDDYRLADALGIVGTPAFVIARGVNSTNPNTIKSVFIPGVVDQPTFAQLITALRKQ